MQNRKDDDNQDFGAILEAFEREQGQRGDSPQRAAPRVGEKVTARIVGFGEESAFVHLGGKSEGVIPLAELTDDQGERTAAVGDTVEALVAAIDDDAGVVVLRVRAGAGGARGDLAAAAAELAQAQAHGIPVEGTVQAVVKGGVEVAVSGLRAFCPISQLDLRFVEDPAAYVGQRLAFRVARFESGRGGRPNVVLSRRALLEEEQRTRAETTRQNLEVGKTLRGTVTSLASYGAFVDLGGLEGLLHVSELGHTRVEHPKEVLDVGQEVDVQVLRIEPARDGKSERISLSRKALLHDPWDEQAALLRIGSRHRGRVARLETFGAFVELAPGVDGLLHVSELGRDREVRHPREVVRPGETVEVTVTAVDLGRRRISLTLAPAASAADDAPPPAAPEPGFGALGDFFDRAERQKK